MLCAMTRLRPYQSRPEDAIDADAYYGSQESQRYHLNQGVVQKQLELTSRALDILSIHAAATLCKGHSLLADIGCGSGLSGVVLSRLKCAWVGCDISQHMLQLAAEAQSYIADAHVAASHDSSRSEHGHGACGLARADIGQGLPFRAGSLDAAISISALQWLLTPLSNTAAPLRSTAAAVGSWQGTAADSSPATGTLRPITNTIIGSERALRFFRSLHICLRPGAAAIAQFYPRDAAEAQTLKLAAAAAGLVTHLIVDCPHKTPARKYYLHISKPASSVPLGAASPPAAKGDKPAASLALPGAGHSQLCNAQEPSVAIDSPQCPLGYPIGGTCSTWWKLQEQQQQGCSSCQPTGRHQGGRGCNLHTMLPADCTAIDEWIHSYHIKHCKKLIRLMIRAAAHSGGLGEILPSNATPAVAADTGVAAVPAPSAVAAKRLAAGTVVACMADFAAPTQKPVTALLEPSLAGAVARTAADPETVAATSHPAAAARPPAGSPDPQVAGVVVGSAAGLRTVAATGTPAAPPESPAADSVPESAADRATVATTSHAAAAVRPPAGSTYPPVAGVVVGSAAGLSTVAATGTPAAPPESPAADSVLESAADPATVAATSHPAAAACPLAGSTYPVTGCVVGSAAGLDTAAATDTPAALRVSPAADTVLESAADLEAIVEVLAVAKPPAANTEVAADVETVTATASPPAAEAVMAADPAVAQAVAGTAANPDTPAAANAAISSYLKVLLQLDLPSCASGCCCHQQSSSGSSTCGSKNQCCSCQPASLNCFGNTLLLSVVGQPADFTVAGLVSTAAYTPSPTAAEGSGGNQHCGVFAAADHDAAASAAGLGQQVAATLQAALQKPPDQQPPAQHCSILHTSCQFDPHQEKGSARLLMAEWVAASDLQSQQATPQQTATPQPPQEKLLHKPAGDRRKARKQYMQATLAALGQAEQYSDACSSQASIEDGSCAAVVSWYRLQTAEAFPPHTVCCVSCHTASSGAVVHANSHGPCNSIDLTAAASTNRHCSTTAAVAQNKDHLPSAEVDNGHFAPFLAQGLQHVREVRCNSSSTSSSGGLLRQQHCLGVYGGLLLLGAGATTWELLLGCY